MRLALATVGTSGDVRPFAALASALAHRGHQVTAVSWSLHGPTFDGSGAGFQPAGPATTNADIAQTAVRAAAERSPTAQVAVLRDFHLRDAGQHYRQLRELLEGQALAVIHGIHSLAQAAADDAGVPWASAVFDPVLLPTASAPPAGMPSLGPLNGLAWRMLDRMLRPLDRPLHEALGAAGSRSRPSLFRGRSPLLHLVACSPSIIAVPPDMPATTHVAGWWPPVADPRSLPPDLGHFLDAGEAPVVVTFGSMTGEAASAVTRTIVDITGRTKRRIVVQDGETAIEAQVAHVGAVDHRLLFPRAALVVHHGGAGTTHAVASAGIPSVVVPHVGDQRYWAGRLHRLGVAPPALKLDARPDAVARALTAASDDRMRAASHALAAQLADDHGLERAVELIEALPR